MMKARIKEDKLQVERNGTWCPQICPYSNKQFKPCGRWCPLFQEGVNLANFIVTISCAPQVCHYELETQSK